MSFLISKSLEGLVDEESLIDKKFIDKAIEIIKLSSITFNNLLLKQIIKKDNLYICKILCKEASN